MPSSFTRLADGQVDIGLASEIPPGSMRCLEVEDRKIVVYHTSSGFFASENSCPHRGGPLAEGDLREDEVTCPWHLWSFDVRTGLTECDPQVRMTRYLVAVVGQRLFLQLL